jgi:hypothetical protein
MDSMEIRERRTVSVEKKECTPPGALFLFGNIIQFTPLESPAVYRGGEVDFLIRENMGFHSPCEPSL